MIDLRCQKTWTRGPFTARTHKMPACRYSTGPVATLRPTSVVVRATSVAVRATSVAVSLLAPWMIAVTTVHSVVAGLTAKLMPVKVKDQSRICSPITTPSTMTHSWWTSTLSSISMTTHHMTCHVTGQGRADEYWDSKHVVTASIDLCNMYIVDIMDKVQDCPDPDTVSLYSL